MSGVRKVGSLSESIHWKIPDFFKAANDLQWNMFMLSEEISSSVCQFRAALDPKGTCTGGRLWISLTYDAATHAPQKTVTCYVGPQKVDICQSVAFDCEATQTTSNYWTFIAAFGLDELRRCESDLVPSDTLTITFYLGEHRPRPETQKEESRRLTGLETMSSCFGDLFVSKKGTDVIIKVKDKDFPVHKAVLLARSPVFSAMFGHDSSEAQTGVVAVPDCDPDSFETLLRHLYNGKFDGVTSENVLDLYVTSDKYDARELKWFCVDHMTENLTAENVLDVVVLAERYGEVELLSTAHDFFNHNFERVISTPRWRTIMKEDLELVNRLLVQMGSQIEVKRTKRRKIERLRRIFAVNRGDEATS